MGAQAFGSLGSFLGFGGDKGEGINALTGNAGLEGLQKQNSAFTSDNGNLFTDALQDYASGKRTAASATSMGSPEERMGMTNALATNPLTGTKFATEQVQNNPILGKLFGDSGLFGKEIDKEQQLQNQGYQLTPEDQTMYGQASGNIARQFGQQGNQMAQDLASRGLGSAPSGAAGALFSGLAGNQNEQLAQAQQNIMQQRFQNTIQQIGQQQNMINSLGGQAGNAINDQFGRQLAGVKQQVGGLEDEASIGAQANAQNNQANLASAGFKNATAPGNIGNLGSAIGGIFGSSFAKNAGGAAGTTAGGGGGGGGSNGGGSTAGGGLMSKIASS